MSSKEESPQIKSTTVGAIIGIVVVVVVGWMVLRSKGTAPGTGEVSTEMMDDMKSGMEEAGKAK